MKFKEDYFPANCCCPQPGDSITGYHSLEHYIKVHRSDCPNLAKADPRRLVKLEWSDILAEKKSDDDLDLSGLDEIDWAVLAHHDKYGFDYSLVVAGMLGIETEIVFTRHKKLRDMGLLARVEPRMIQYRKGIVKGKWVKHRNHTYYDLTDKGRRYLKQKGESD